MTSSSVDFCVACCIRGTGMVAIFRHPNALDQMFHSVTGIVVESDDHLCIPCYDDLKTSYIFKQKCIQHNILRVSRPSTASAGGPAKTGSEEDVDGPVEEEFIESDPDEVVLPLQQDERKESTDDAKEGDGEEQSSNKDNETDGWTESDFAVAAILHEEEVMIVERRKSVNHAPKECNEAEAEADDDQKVPAVTKIPRVHNLMCRYCFREFTVLGEKVTHEETHRDDPKPFKCFHGDCSGSFKDRVGLRSHVRLHSAVKRYQCRYCPKRFHQCSNHLAHERTHNGVKPYICPHCGKGFAENGNLKNHIRSHTNERPYSCTFCRKTFRTHYSRTVHGRSHSGERPYLCNQCGKGFYASGKLLIHQRSHTGDRPYKCATCSARFVEKSGLQRHLKIHD